MIDASTISKREEARRREWVSQGRDIEDFPVYCKTLVELMNKVNAFCRKNAIHKPKILPADDPNFLWLGVVAYYQDENRKEHEINEIIPLEFVKEASQCDQSRFRQWRGETWSVNKEQGDRFCLRSDEAGHWYLIPVNERLRFDELLYNREDEIEFLGYFSDCRLDMSITQYSFKDFKEL